jgi:uncharacterized protein
MFPDTEDGLNEFVRRADGTRQYTRITEGYFRLIADGVKGELRPPYGAASFTPPLAGR